MFHPAVVFAGVEKCHRVNGNTQSGLVPAALGIKSVTSDDADRQDVALGLELGSGEGLPGCIRRLLSPAAAVLGAGTSFGVAA